MAKIHSENLIADFRAKSAQKTALEASSSINKLKTSPDSVVNNTRQKLTLEEATRLGRDITKQFSDSSEPLEAQGSGLTEDRVNQLLSDD